MVLYNYIFQRRLSLSNNSIPTDSEQVLQWRMGQKSSQSSKHESSIFAPLEENSPNASITQISLFEQMKCLHCNRNSSFLSIKVNFIFQQMKTKPKSIIKYGWYYQRNINMAMQLLKFNRQSFHSSFHSQCCWNEMALWHDAYKNSSPQQ